MQLPELIEPFVQRLEALAIPYMVTGRTAGILYGEPRMTHDIDIVIALSDRDVARFVAAFPLEDFYCPPEDVLAIEVRRGQRGHANLIHHATGSRPTSTSRSTSFTAGAPHTGERSSSMRFR